ncbi:MAG: TraM recognition domain-containing protein [Kineosporiaceae bacterium]
MLFRIQRALRHYPAPPVAAVAILLLMAWGTWKAHVLPGLGHTALVGAVGLFCFTTIAWYVVHLGSARSTGQWVGRRDEQAQRAGGVANWLDIGELAGTSATRKRAVVLRPSLRRTSPWRRRFVPLTEYAVPVVKVGWLPVGSTVWSTCEDVTVRFGGPRSGKSGSLACHALDAPGALVVTTSRTDLLEDTREDRERRGEVEVFNPTGLGDLKSTVRWSALSGCQEYATALRRAGDLIPESASAEGERWDSQARGLLAILLHAAALDGRRLSTVLDWISPADAVAREQIVTALADSPAGDNLVAAVHSLYTTNERTLTSITTTMLPALRWLNDATAAETGDAALDDPHLLDVARLVASGRDSLYLIGRDGAARTLIGALTAEVAHQVRMHAAKSPSGRLDPPMTALLDEAPLTCGPIPLQDWTADMGGRGFTIHIAAQSPAQLRDVWGHDKAAAIMGNAATLMVFGGLKTARDLEDLSTLCGTRMMALDADDVRPQPVMTAQQISSLPMGTALVLRNGMRPVIGRAPVIWERTDRGLTVAETAANLRERLAAAVAAYRSPAEVLLPADGRRAAAQPAELSGALPDEDGGPIAAQGGRP